MKVPKIIDRFIEWALTEHRGLFCLFCLLPISLLFDAYNYLRGWIAYRFLRPLVSKSHEERVKDVQKQLISWKHDGAKQRLCTARPAWLTMSPRIGTYKSKFRGIHVDGLKNILEVDTRRGVVRVEPNVDMGQLHAVLEPMGWTLKVCAELDDLTVGGLIMGYGVETSSHKYGLFKDTVRSMEVVLPDGSVRVLTPDDDLFHAIPWSHGTLCFLVSCEVEIEPAGKYVELTYTPLYTQRDTIEQFEIASRDTENIDFVELLVFDHDLSVLMTGKHVNQIDSNKGKLNSIGKWHKPWFYEHVMGFLKRREVGIEYIPLVEYYHRHNRAIFWALREIIPFGNHPLFRTLLGWAAIKPNLLKLTQTESTRKLYDANYIVHDTLVPVEQLKGLFDTAEKHWNVFPIWVCPFRVPQAEHSFLRQYKRIGDSPVSRDVRRGEIDELWVDVAYVGTYCYDDRENRTCTARTKDPVTAFKAVEQWLLNNGAAEALYCDCYLNREDFRQMFDHTMYDRARKKEIPLVDEAFPEIWDKVTRTSSVGRSDLR